MLTCLFVHLVSYTIPSFDLIVGRAPGLHQRDQQPKVRSIAIRTRLYTSRRTQYLHAIPQGALLADTSVTSSQKGAICEALAVADKCLADGADELLQLLNVCGTARSVLQG